MFCELPLKPRCGAKHPDNGTARKAKRLKIVLGIHWQHFGLGVFLAECGEFPASQVP